MKTLLRKTFTIILACLLPSLANTATVVTANTGGSSSIYGPNSTYVQSSIPAIQNITTSITNFNTSMFGAAPTVGEQFKPYDTTSRINGVSYDVWMSGPVLSRYYNTNVFNANRSYYAIDGTLPLNNETIIPGAFGFGVY